MLPALPPVPAVEPELPPLPDLPAVDPPLPPLPPDPPDTPPSFPLSSSPLLTTQPTTKAATKADAATLRQALIFIFNSPFLSR